MKTNEEIINKLIEEVTLFNEISPGDIPDIELYMDQITTFFEDRLKHLKRGKEDPILTKTMINNYTKGKILMPPNKKKYSKEHLMLLILIYNLKQVISINDIQDLFTPLIKEISSSNSKLRLEEIYTFFLSIKENELETFKTNIVDRFALIESKIDESVPEKQEMIELLLIVMMLVHQAGMYKKLAEKIIDNFFKEDIEKKVKK